MKMFILMLLWCLVVTSVSARQERSFISGRYTLSGTVTDIDKKVVVQAQVILSLKDSLCGVCLTDGAGKFRMTGLAGGEYFLQILAPGFAPLEQTYYLRDNSYMDFALTAVLDETLEDLVVTADRSEDVKRTATGKIFYLSEKAKNSGDAYQALNEIPRIVSNSAMQTLKMANGSTPLILIDGNKVNTGINPVNPRDIESVEVIDVVSARYLRMGVKNIINIKLKKKENPYIYFQPFVRYEINRKIWGALESEIGNPNYSLYARASYDGYYQDDTHIYQRQQDEGYEKVKDGIQNNPHHLQRAKLEFKWRISEKDYFSLYIDGQNKLKKYENTGTGSYITRQLQDFTYRSFTRNNDYILTSNLYYKHMFAPDQILETSFAYNKNGNKSKGEHYEIYPDRYSDNFYEYKNNRSSIFLNMDYSWKWNKINILNIGSETKYVKDKIHEISENYPVFLHKEWTQYLYAEFSSKAGNLLYMISAGAEGIWLEAGDVSNSYIKPRMAASATYEFNKNNSLLIGYSLSNTAPSVRELNPYNTSADPLVITMGNPALLPVQNHEFKLNYTLNIHDLYIEPDVSYDLYTDMIEPYGYSQDGIYISTYKNTGRFKRLSLGGSVSCDVTDWLSIDAAAYHHVDYFSGQDPMKSFSCEGSVQLTYKKWMLLASMEYQNYEYTPLSRTKQLSPDYSHVMIKYNVTKNLNITAAVSFFINTPDIETFTRSGTYTSYSTQYMVNPVTPWIVIRYTLRKNSKRKIKLNNVPESKETGITL